MQRFTSKAAFANLTEFASKMQSIQSRDRSYWEFSVASVTLIFLILFPQTASTLWCRQSRSLGHISQFEKAEWNCWHEPISLTRKVCRRRYFVSSIVSCSCIYFTFCFFILSKRRNRFWLSISHICQTTVQVSLCLLRFLYSRLPLNLLTGFRFNCS